MSKLGQLLKRQRLVPESGKLKLRKRTKARARTRGNHNRRVVKVDSYLSADAFGGLSKKEQLYHFTKGYRVRTA